MAIYQFLIATQFTYRDGPGMMQDEAGNPTAHIVGLFNRTVQFLENGIKPVWVFDGAAPVMKGGTLEERTKRKEEAKEKLETLQAALEELTVTTAAIATTPVQCTAASRMRMRGLMRKFKMERNSKE